MHAVAEAARRLLGPRHLGERGRDPSARDLDTERGLSVGSAVGGREAEARGGGFVAVVHEHQHDPGRRSRHAHAVEDEGHRLRDLPVVVEVLVPLIEVLPLGRIPREGDLVGADLLDVLVVFSTID